MAKTKNKKKSLADSVRAKKKGLGEKVNPFEVKVNRQKHKVVGQKLTKFDKGRPGQSRSRAIEKRKETLLVEYRKRGKANTFLDKRIGENDPEMTMEEKMLKRYAAERQKTSHKSIFNLNEDEEELTHYGQSLSQIEKFDAPVGSDDDEDDDGRGGNIGAKMVSEEFFGGGILSKKDEEDGKNKTWKERMEEIIAKSKKQKFERQHEKEQVLQMTEEVDLQWRDIRQSISGAFKKRTDDSDVKKSDDYDQMVRELQFAIKGTPSDRMKTEEELAKEEKQKLEKLEADRLRRMKGLSEAEDSAIKKAYRSADSLDDDFYAEPEAERFEAFYKDGKLVRADDNASDQSGSGDASGDEEHDEVDSEEGSDDENDEGESSAESDDAMAHLSDLESSENDDLSDDEQEGSFKEESKDEGKCMKANQKEKQVTGKTREENREKDDTKSKKLSKSVQFDLKSREEEIEAAKKELPYTFKAPSTYEELLSILNPYSEMEQVICIERLRKCYHPSLAEGNKQKLQTLFTLLVQYYGDLAIHKPSPLFWLIDKLVPHLYELSQQSKESKDAAAQAMLDVVLAKQAQYCEVCQRRNGRGVYPQLDVLMYFKLVSMLYPTSDFHHPVVTPTMLFMSQILNQSCVNTTRDVASGLLLCNLFLEYVSFSKRFVPEVINFLNGLLFLSYEKETNKIEPVVPPFKPVGKNIDLLVFKEAKTDRKLSEKLRLGDIYTPSKAFKYLASDQFRLDAVHLAIKLLQAFCDLYDKLPAHAEIFKPTLHFCKKLTVEQYPQTLQDSINNLQEIITKRAERTRTFLRWEKKKTTALKLYEPKVEEDFDPTRKSKASTTSKAKEEKQKLVAKHRKEMKGAIREIRRDAQFLAKQRLEDQLKRDSERKRKVKEILGDLATQQGDINALKRQKGKS